MKDIELFQMALDIPSPWFVESLELDPAAKRLDIHPDFQKGSKFTCPECGAEGRKVHDTANALMCNVKMRTEKYKAIVQQYRLTKKIPILKPLQS